MNPLFIGSIPRERPILYPSPLFIGFSTLLLHFLMVGRFFVLNNLKKHPLLQIAPNFIET